MIQQRHRSAVLSAPLTTPVALLLGGAGADGPDETIANSALLEAWSSGMRTCVLDRAALLAARGPEARTLSDVASGIDVTRPGACVDWARTQLALGRRFDVVLGLRDDVQQAAAETAAALGLPGNHPDAVRAAQDNGVCLAALAAAGIPVEVPGAETQDRATSPGTTDVTVAGAFTDGHPYVLLIATRAPEGWAAADRIPPDEHTALGVEATAAVRRLGLGYGLFRVDLRRRTGRSTTVCAVRLTLGTDGLQELLTRTSPGTELFNLVYDDALDRSPGSIPTAPRVPWCAPEPPLASASVFARRAAFRGAPVLRLAGDPDDASAEPHICRGID